MSKAYKPDGSLMDISELYRIDSLEDIVGNAPAILAIKEFIDGFIRGRRSRPLMVFGPTGTGKTATINALVRDESLNVIELNASDYRDSYTISSKITPALNTRPLFKRHNLIVFDEIDELSGRYDRGAAAVINSMIKDPRVPIVFIANDMWDQSIAFLRGKTTPVEFKKPGRADIAMLLRRLSDRYKMDLKEGVFDWIAKMCDGDVRSAINDMYVMAGAEEDDLDVIGMRDKKSDIFTTMDKIFASHTISGPMRAAMYSDVDPGMLINWLEENIPNRYPDIVSIERAYRSLSYSSIFSSRASRSGYYTYWRYMSVLMSGGVALAKDNGYITTKRYSFPRAIKDLSVNKSDRNTSYAISEKMKRGIHSSIYNIMSSEMMIIKRIISESIANGIDRDEVYDYFASRFDLTEKEFEWLIG